MATRIFHVVFRAIPRHVSSNSDLGKVSLTRVELYIPFCVACHACVQLVGSTYLNVNEVIAGECVCLSLILFCRFG
jgi:hypothetical protein